MTIYATLYLENEVKYSHTYNILL